MIRCKACDNKMPYASMILLLYKDHAVCQSCSQRFRQSKANRLLAFFISWSPSWLGTIFYIYIFWGKLQAPGISAFIVFLIILVVVGHLLSPLAIRLMPVDKKGIFSIDQL